MLEHHDGVGHQMADAMDRGAGDHPVGMADRITDRGNTRVHAMRPASGPAQAPAKGDEDVDRDLIVIEVPARHCHRLKPVEFMPPFLGLGPVEELVTGHGGDAHGVHGSRRRAGVSPAFRRAWVVPPRAAPGSGRAAARCTAQDQRNKRFSRHIQGGS